MDDRAQHVEKLRELIKDVRIAMLTTVEADGMLRSRPMAMQEAEFDGDLWFFTRDDAPKVAEIASDPAVNLAFADPDAQTYISLSGRARLVRDREKLEALWRPIYRAWFPDGLDDPHLALLCVEADHAEYWDAASGKLVQAFALAKTLVTGKTDHRAPPGTENEKVDL